VKRRLAEDGTAEQDLRAGRDAVDRDLHGSRDRGRAWRVHVDPRRMRRGGGRRRWLRPRRDDG
jgi:hypothetical protein